MIKVAYRRICNYINILFSSGERLEKREFYNKPTQSDYAYPFSSLAKSMRKVITDLQVSILERSPNFGCLELRENISLYLARSRGIYASVEQIIIGAGSEYLYGIITSLFGRDKNYARVASLGCRMSVFGV